MVVSDPQVDRLSYLLALKSVPGIGNRSAVTVLTAFPTARDLTAASSEQVSSLGRRIFQALSKVSQDEFARLLEKGRQDAEDHLDAGFCVLSLFDRDYPPLLRLIPYAPLILFVRGSLPTLRDSLSIAIVGTRSPTARGSDQAYRLAVQAADAGITVVSGLALGIDTAAHEGTLDARGKTVAVLGTPINRIYPPQNLDLAEQIVESGGALVSEYGINEHTDRRSFVQRNRIQSGLSLAVIAVQTDIEGGTMHTVRFALEQDRLVMCPIPHPEESNAWQTAGVYRLLHDGTAHVLNDLNEAVQEKLREHRERLLGSKAPDGEGFQPLLSV
ncbi:MAG: DNA-processing protein DprA [Limnochordia bacterium]